MNMVKAAPKLLVARSAPRPVAKRTPQDRLNVILGIISVSLFAAMVFAAVSEVLEAAPSTWQELR